MKASGGTVFAQDGSAEYGGMPQAAIASGAVDRVLPLEQIAPAIVDFVRPFRE